MARYIDADKIHTFVDETFPDGVPYEWAWTLTAIDKAPTADVVEVVRCKDCTGAEEHSNSPVFYKCNGCNFMRGRLVSGEFWCKCGKQKGGARMDGRSDT